MSFCNMHSSSSNDKGGSMATDPGFQSRWRSDFSLAAAAVGGGGGGGAFVFPRGLVQPERQRQPGPWTQRTGSLPAASVRGSPGRVCASLESSEEEAAASKKAFNDVLKKGNTEECLKHLQLSGSKLKLGMAEARKLLNVMSDEFYKDLPAEDHNDDALINTYKALKAAGLLRGFGSIDFAKVSSKSRDVSAEKLLSMSGVEKQNLAPGRPTGSWLLAGVGVFGAEYLAGWVMGLDPLQTVIPWTVGLIVADRLLLNGAVAESLTRLIVPGYRERIIRHEAGHFLVAYLLGCPVQGCLLDPFELPSGLSGAQGGTVFADPILSKQMAEGKLTKSSIDRFSIVLMGGIAAEAINYGSSEGGSADESVMVGILSTIVPPFDREQIKSQALWGATQAVLLIQEHKEAYEVLSNALERGAELGECVSLIEAELAKRELPGDVRRSNGQPASPAGEMRGMLVRRMSQRNRSEKERVIKEAVQQAKLTTTTPAAETTTAATPARTKLQEDLAKKDAEMLNLQRQVEDLERRVKSGTSIVVQSLEGDSGGVWMNDLKALREDITAMNEKNTIASAAPDTPPATPLAEEPSPASSPREAKKAEILRDIDLKTAENAKRLAEVEARLRMFEKQQQQR